MRVFLSGLVVFCLIGSVAYGQSDDFSGFDSGSSSDSSTPVSGNSGSDTGLGFSFFGKSNDDTTYASSSSSSSSSSSHSSGITLGDLIIWNLIFGQSNNSSRVSDSGTYVSSRKTVRRAGVTSAPPLNSFKLSQKLSTGEQTILESDAMALLREGLEATAKNQRIQNAKDLQIILKAFAESTIFHYVALEKSYSVFTHFLLSSTDFENVHKQIVEANQDDQLPVSPEVHLAIRRMIAAFEIARLPARLGLPLTDNEKDPMITAYFNLAHALKWTKINSQQRLELANNISAVLEHHNAALFEIMWATSQSEVLRKELAQKLTKMHSLGFRVVNGALNIGQYAGAVAVVAMGGLFLASPETLEAYVTYPQMAGVSILTAAVSSWHAVRTRYNRIFKSQPEKIMQIELRRCLGFFTP